tara:strand:- start:189 stop:395 length:207 start_codon:yes stop_codon:yes gene_type:complete
MAIDPEVISPSSTKGRRASRYHPNWAIYGAAGLGVFFLVSFVKTLLPAIGIAFLLAFIWSQSSTFGRH